MAGLGWGAAVFAREADGVERSSWAAKFVCDTGGDLDDGAVAGIYATAVNVHNATLETAAVFRSVARALPGGPAPPAGAAELLVIPPGGAVEIECDEIRRLLPLPMTGQHRTGFVHLVSATPLDVTAVYSSRAEGGEVSSSDAESVPARPLRCAPGTTGDDCSMACPGGVPCEAILTRNRDATVNGVRMFGSVLTDGVESDEALAGYLELAAANAALFALDPVDDPAIFELTAGSTVASASMRIHRYAQHYRGLPVVGPGSALILTVAPPHGVISATGTLVDPRPDYAGLVFGVLDEPAAAQRALELWQSDGPGGAASIVGLELVALPLRRALGYRARIAVAGEPGGSVVFEAALTGTGALVNLIESAGIPAPPQVTVRARDWTIFNDPFPGALDDFNTTRVAAGAGIEETELQGSTVDPSLCDDGPPECIRLGDARVAVYDRGEIESDDENDIDGDDGVISQGDLLTDPEGEFLASSIAGQSNFPFKVQTHYHKLRAALGVLDDLKECRWDWFSSSGMGACDVPQLALLFNVRMGPSGRFVPSTLDWNEAGWLDNAGTALEPGWLALGHEPQVNPGGDTLAPSTIQIRDGAKESTLYHEIGHYIDWFTAAGLGAVDEEGQSIRDIADPCPVPSSFPGCCRPHTSDEAAALAESIASLFATYFGRRLHELGPRGETIPFSLPTIQSPLAVPTHGEGLSHSQVREYGPLIGGATPEMGCDYEFGYNQRWLFQAFWELADGVVCDVVWQSLTPPCDTFEVRFSPAEVSPADVQLQTLHHALLKQPPEGGAYRDLVNDMGEFLECTYGADQRGETVFDHFVAVYTHHGMPPATPMPRECPPICGFNGLEEGEECEGDDLAGESCASRGFDGGELACTAGCVFDTSGCQLCGDDERQGSEVCDGDDLAGESCETQGFDGGGLLVCSPGCDGFDTEACLPGCEPGEPACECLEGGLDLPGNGLLGDGRHCLDDVTLGGNVRCVADGPDFVCRECTFNQGWGCPCGVGEDSCLFDEDDPPDLGDDLFCWGHTTPPSFTGNCWDVPPDWYCDAHCGQLGLACVDQEQVLCGDP